MVKVTDRVSAVTGATTFICDYSPPRSGNLLDAPRPPVGADFILVNRNPGRSVRMDSAMLAASLKQQWNCEVIFALLTRDMNRLAIQSYLLGAQALGLDNVVVAQGDDFSGSDAAMVKTVRDYRATELIEAISSMNYGRDFRGRALAAPTEFCVGATFDTAGRMSRQLELATSKVVAGAEFMVTQPIFDPKIRDDFENSWLEATGELFPATMFWGLQMLEAGSVSFGPVPEVTLRELERGRSGVEIALELFDRFRGFLIEYIYLLPPVRPGGERNYAAAQEFLETARKMEARKTEGR